MEEPKFDLDLSPQSAPEIETNLDRTQPPDEIDINSLVDGFCRAYDQKVASLGAEHLGVDDDRYDILLAETLFETLPVLEETAKPLIRLHLFNFVAANSGPDTKAMEREVRKILSLSQTETEFSSSDNPLPTIGVELEIPNQYWSEGLNNVLNWAGIHHEVEASIRGVKAEIFEEINPQFSYSARVQSQILEEITKLGHLPMIRGRNGQMQMSKISEDLLSLHMNFGLQEPLDHDMLLTKYSDQLLLINNIIAYGFSSPIRLQNRKTDKSLLLKDDAEESKKIKADFIPDSILISFVDRIELRAGEFRDYPTFRMLAESQRIMAMMFAYIQAGENRTLTDRESQLAQLAHDFLLDAEQIVLPITDQEINLIDTDKYKAADLAASTKISEFCRKLITDYSHRVAKILQLETEEENS